MASLGVITWSCQAFYYLFTEQEFPEKRIRFFEDRVLDKGDASLGDLGLLHGQLALCLGIACIVVFVFVAAGTKSLGKVCNLLYVYYFVLQLIEKIMSFLTTN